MVEDSAEAWRALDDYRAGSVDFADALIARINKARSCETTVTFDGKAARMASFTGL